VDETRVGIVCSVREAGESDRLAVIFGPECGRFTALVKGARKPQSKLAGIAQPFCEGRFYLRESRSGLVLYAAEIVRFHKKIQESVKKLAVGTYWLELLTGAPWPEDQWEPLFRLVVNSLNMLTDTPKARELSALVASKIVKLSGLYPETAHCAKCGAPIYEGSAVLDREIALSYHQKCAPQYASGETAGITLSSSILGTIYRLYSVPLKEFETFWESETELKDVERLISRILENAMERKLNTRKFLEDALGW
jgi:DNA repair protein RecO (recombination protein O)